MSIYNDFNIYLKEYGVQDASGKYFNYQLPKTVQAFAKSQERRVSYTISLNDAAELAQRIFCDEHDNEDDYDDHFEPLPSDTKHFSIHLLKSSPDIVVVISNDAIISLWDDYRLINDDQIAILRISNTNTKPLISKSTALFLLSQANFVQGLEISLPAIPSFESQHNDEQWLNSALQNQRDLIEKAIAYGYIHRFDEPPPPSNLSSFLNTLSEKERFDWMQVHPVQRRMLSQGFSSLLMTSVKVSNT